MRSFLSVALLILTSAALTQTVKQSDLQRQHSVWEPPEWDFPQGLKATVSKEMFSTFTLSGVSITFEETSIESVRERLGGKGGQRGDAGDALKWLCFHSRDPADRWVLWLESGEIDGGSVGSFQWQRLSNDDVVDSRCQALGGGSVTLPLSFRLGAKKAEVLKSLGGPTSTESQRLIYLHEHEGKIKGQPFAVSNIIVVHIRDGLVWAIQASKTSSS